VRWGHVVYDLDVPREAITHLREPHRNGVATFAKIFCESFGVELVWEHDSEVDLAGASEVVAIGL
jgi:hypothetical protein